jgi:hypothetical protein
MRRLNVGRLLSPDQRRLLSDVGGVVLLQKRDEIDQPFARLLQLESQAASHL